VIEVRNSSRGIALLDVLGKGNNVDSVSSTGQRKGEALGQAVVRSLSSSNKVVTFYTSYVLTTYSWLAVSIRFYSSRLRHLLKRTAAHL
jgi:hypothetical protein